MTPHENDMLLRVALPNKGSLSEPAISLLRDADYQVRRENRELFVIDAEHGIQFFFLRPRDIARFVGDGAVDLGITGQDLLADSGAAAEEVLSLGFARSQFRLAARPGAISDLSQVDGQRLATSYPTLVRKFLAEAGVQATVITLEGAVENAVELGLATVVADVVESGLSLRNAGLEPFGPPLLTSEAIMVRGAVHRHSAKAAALDLLVQRLQGVLHARTYALIEYNCPERSLADAYALTPGLEAPTVSKLAEQGWYAVRSMVERSKVQKVMDQLKGIGAEGIFTTRLDAFRA
ncbi:ATP phosphoribosyltransferase [Goodfellowiella coeruleoviolacea]|uniref:ATP phosphoribosyltransferase n=1 Tax=Goodfellowiella coeruleoviolacea TaxID=334858 RepID=A0AAE3GI07_9PSEU|nr:ATP phosphoribosyltransferase [Goodfellowiella coeruleoviolacea]MCP2168551.1 ATP phosphoribosyltransferase (homohexameric) (EC 2.4.2.17) [Goodfellowiella coeruleoviolacea]